MVGSPLLLLSLFSTMATCLTGTAALVNQPVVYEISTRPWLYALSNKYGKSITLDNIPASEFQAIADLGVDVVWMMGVWSLGGYGLHHDRTDAGLLAGYGQVLPGYTQDDIIGSPYAITNYTVNPFIGSDSILAKVRSLLNSMGMKLMVDLVPNHSAVDGEWTLTNPDFFVNKPSNAPADPSVYLSWGGRDIAFGADPYDGAWTDTLQYNYWNPALRQAMAGVLMSLASQADAVRCDMAMLLLNDVIEKKWGGTMAANGYSRPGTEFWGDAISAVKKKYPDFVMLAEAYNYGITSPSEDALLQQLGFDYTYDKQVLDNLKLNNLQDVRGYVKSQSGTFFSRCAHFVENHDEPRAASSLGGQQQAFAGSVVAATLPGLKLFYFGQFLGFSSKLDVHLLRAVADTPNTALQAQYAKLLAQLVNASSPFQPAKAGTSSWAYVELGTAGTAWRLMAWRYGAGTSGDRRLVVINFSNTQGWGNAVLPDASGTSGDNLDVTELLSGTTYTRSASALRSSGLVVGVKPWSAQIFSY